jgi:hypothetical protein
VSDIPITISGPVATPATYTLSPLERWTPTGVSATFDGTGAAGDFLPCCSIYSQTGDLLGRMFPEVVTAGDVAEVTYSPFSKTQGGGIKRITSSNGSITVTNPTGPIVDLIDAFTGIRFGIQNFGSWLVTKTSSFFDLSAHPLADPASVGGTWGTSLQDASGHGIVIASLGGDARLQSSGANVFLLADMGNVTVFSNQGDVKTEGNNVLVQLDAVTGTLTVVDRLFAPLFRIDQNGALHGKTGQSLVFDL